MRMTTYKIREWNSRVKGAIKRLNRNRKEFEDATGLCEERTQREEEEKEEDHFLLFH